MGAITKAMLEQHSIINSFLIDFEKTSEDESGRLKDKFDVFKWNLQKHVFTEENNIFIVANKKNPVEMRQLQNLLKDHKDIIAIISDLDDEISQGRKPEVSILSELLFAHEGREIKSFYPLLDNRLSDKKKKEILERAGEIFIGD